MTGWKGSPIFCDASIDRRSSIKPFVRLIYGTAVQCFVDGLVSGQPRDRWFLSFPEREHHRERLLYVLCTKGRQRSSRKASRVIHRCSFLVFSRRIVMVRQGRGPCFQQISIPLRSRQTCSMRGNPRLEFYLLWACRNRSAKPQGTNVKFNRGLEMMLFRGSGRGLRVTSSEQIRTRGMCLGSPLCPVRAFFV